MPAELFVKAFHVPLGHPETMESFGNPGRRSHRQLLNQWQDTGILYLTS